MNISGNKDTDLIVLSKLHDKEFFIFCGKKESFEFQNKYINKLSKNETLWKERLFKYYGEFYPEAEETWKNLYLSLVVHMDKYNYKKDKYSFINASANGHLNVVKYLMSLPEEYGISPNAENNLAIRRACKFGHLNMVKYLTSLPEEYGVDPSAEDNYAIRWASVKGHLDVIKYLMSLPEEYKISPSADDNWAIHWAIQNNHLNVEKYLTSLPKEYGIHLNQENNICFIQ